MSTPTVVTFRTKIEASESEQDAYVWLIDHFIASGLDAGRAPYLATSPVKLLRLGRLANGMFVELNLSNEDKVARLDKLGDTLGLRRGVDWTWSAANRPPPAPPIDVNALFAELGIT